MTDPALGPAERADLEALLSSMTDQEVARYKNSLEVDDQRLEVVLGWMQAHDIDD